VAPGNAAVKAAPMAFQSERKNRYGHLSARAIRNPAMKPGCRLLNKALLPADDLPKQVALPRRQELLH
jgi:hypothetical protein